jgi:hypothetical protein
MDRRRSLVYTGKGEQTGKHQRIIR